MSSSTADAQAGQMMSARETPLLGVRLSIMMFLQYAVWGAWLPIVGRYLTAHLGFTLTEVGLIAGTAGLVAGVASLMIRRTVVATAAVPA